MKQFFLSFFLVLQVAATVWGQSGHHLKVMGAFSNPDRRSDFSISPAGGIFEIMPKHSRIISPVLGYSWWSGNRVEHTVELAELVFSNRQAADVHPSVQVNTQFQREELRVRLRYGFQYRISDRAGAKYWFAVGGGCSLYYNEHSVTGNTADFWPRQNKESGMTLDLNPGFSFLLWPRVRLETSLPLTIGAFYSDWSRVSNPALNPAQQTNSSNNLNFGVSEKYFRVGLAFKL